MLAVLLITAAAAQPSDWYAAPVVSFLQPVRDPFLYRWQNNVSAVMSGRTASPLFRASAAQMDVYWRLAAFDTETPWISTQDAQLAMEHAGLGALLALQLSTDQIVSRSPEFSTVQRSLRTLAGPSMVIEKEQEGVRVQLNERPRSQRVAMASLQEPLRGRRPSPQVRVSSGLRVVEVTRTSPIGEDYTILRPGLSLTAGAEHLGPVNLQLRTSLLQERINQTTVDWRAAIRLRALPGISLLGDAQGDEQLVARLQTGVEWRLPVAPLVTSRIIGSYRVDDGEQRVMLQVNRPLQWHIPSDIQRWPLGQELDARGPSPIRRLEISPGPLVRLVPEQVARDALTRQRDAASAAEDAKKTATDEGS
ncbi:MAG: hypothetical protein P8R54_10515 [Myxococcota bacterium]|nr:hypothetical protein [Myxococcota bacterium]